MSRASVLAAATGIQVGAALVASAAVVDTTGSALLAFLRYAIAVAALAPFARASFRAAAPAIARADLLPICLLGVGQFGALIWLLNVAVSVAAAPRVALVFATLPAATAFVAWLAERRTPPARTVLGIGASIAGVAVLVGAGALGAYLRPGEAYGLGCAALATLVAAVCSARYRPYLARYGVRRVSVLAMLASLVPLAALVPFEAGRAFTLWGVEDIALIAFVGLSSAIGYAMWLAALARMDAAKVTAFLALSPITATLLSAVLFGTPLAVPDLAALGLVLAGLGIIATGDGVRRTDAC